KQIADAMGISIKTVKVHRARVMERLEVTSIAALVHACETIGLTADSATGR
ncbi:MAG TPA: LuxR C-terminal-related transcriptional regulator, partial [Caldimonas sp.]|nr:LuxR C-terminal-related transcriptional regulator [Caldimonas sp.]